MRETKANPKIGDKEWVVSFTGKKDDQASSSLEDESMSDTPILMEACMRSFYGGWIFEHR